MQATRRNLVQLAGAAASGLLGAKMSGFAIATAAPEASVSSAPPPIERLTIRRRGVGLRGYDPERAFAGFTLFSPLSSSNKTVYLVDMLGNVVHTWTMPYPPGQSGYLTERGTLFYNGQIPNESHVGQAPYRGGAALEMDWKGRILWEVNHSDHNHDGIRLKNGSVLLICQKPLPVDLVPKVRGGRPGSEYDDGKMDAPYLVEMTISGQIVWEWLSWEHLDPGQDMITADQDDRDVWTVANGVSEMPDGNLLVSFRDISTVVMINRRTGAIYWKLGAPPLAGQHAPHILSNGNLLLFDNGPHRLDHSFPFSRVLEIDPATKAIVWKYQEARVSDFFSPRISNAQRLPNGNTFINEGWFGRFFEVTREGAIVWEYVNPYFGARQQLMINAVQRAYRYSAADIARAQSAA
jgi:arylsulfotransferase ASST